MENSILIEEISTIIDKYFPEKTSSPKKDSDTISIKHAIENCKGYIKKSDLNKLLIEKGYLHKSKDFENYSYNIPYSDIKILSHSKAILDRLLSKTNYNFSDYMRLRGYKNYDLYMYKFKYIIKYKFNDGFKNLFTELEVYKVIAKELSLEVSMVKDYLERLNHPDFPEIPEDVLFKLLRLFNIEKSECLTN